MASGEPRGESPMAGTTSRLAPRWRGRLRLNGVVRVLQAHPMSLDLICRTAVYVTRTQGGVGGGSREASPYPDWPFNIRGERCHVLRSFNALQPF